MLHDFWENFRHNLFKPLLLFFYMGFSVPILKVAFEFPYVLYQGLTIYLLISIGWEGGEKLANLSSAQLSQAGGFMIVGFITNFCIGILAYLVLKSATKLRPSMPRPWPLTTVPTRRGPSPRRWACWVLPALPMRPTCR